jgi:hypothetical protein
MEGRIVRRLILGARQHRMLIDPAWEVGGADLVRHDGVYYLHVTQSQEAPDEAPPVGGALGVDLGTANIATDSEGERFSGAVIRVVRARYHLRGHHSAAREASGDLRRQALWRHAPRREFIRRLYAPTVVYFPVHRVAPGPPPTFAPSPLDRRSMLTPIASPAARTGITHVPVGLPPV